jgi:hypothetical protein
MRGNYCLWRYDPILVFSLFRVGKVFCAQHSLQRLNGVYL